MRKWSNREREKSNKMEICKIKNIKYCIEKNWWISEKEKKRKIFTVKTKHNSAKGSIFHLNAVIAPEKSKWNRDREERSVVG